MGASSILEWITFQAEYLGFLFGTIYVVLAIKKNYWCWIAGIVNVAMLIIVFYRSALYGAAGLQVLYLGMSLYGLLLWIKPNQKGTSEEGDDVKITTPRTFYLLALFIAISAPLSGYILSFTDNAVPYWDGLITALGLAATWMTARKLLENWLVWIVGDTICVAVYAQQALYPTAGLYLLFTIMAVVGYVEWKKPLIRKQTL